MQNNFLMGVKFWTSWGVARTIFKITMLRRLFSKMVSNLTVLEGIFETKFQGRFFFRKKNSWISSVKLKASWINFKGIFHIKLKSKNFKRVSFVKLKAISVFNFRRVSLIKLKAKFFLRDFLIKLKVFSIFWWTFFLLIRFILKGFLL